MATSREMGLKAFLGSDSWYAGAERNPRPAGQRSDRRYPVRCRQVSYAPSTWADQALRFPLLPRFTGKQGLGSGRIRPLRSASLVTRKPADSERHRF